MEINKYLEDIKKDIYSNYENLNFNTNDSILIGITIAYRIKPNEFRETIIGNQIKENNKDKSLRLILFNDDVDILQRDI